MESNNLSMFIPFENLIMFLPYIIIALTGYYFKNNPPQKINKLMGYRTKRSMKSQEAWDFAQVYSSSLMFTWSIAGMVGLVLQLIVQKSVAPTSFAISSIGILLIICAGVFYFTEKELKQNFPKNT